MKDTAVGTSTWRLTKLQFPEAVRAKAEEELRNGADVADVIAKYMPKTIDKQEFEGNVFLNEGIQELWDITCGLGTPTVYNNANARVGVGNGTAAEAATQTGLQGASTAFKAMDATYPSRSGQEVTFRGTFGSADGNFAWEEATVDNGATPNKNLNRKVQSMGTKASGTTWILEVKLTIA